MSWPPLKLLLRQASRSTSMAAVLPAQVAAGDLAQERQRVRRAQRQRTQLVELLPGHADLLRAVQEGSTEGVLHVRHVRLVQLAEAEDRETGGQRGVRAGTGGAPAGVTVGSAAASAMCASWACITSFRIADRVAQRRLADDGHKPQRAPVVDDAFVGEKATLSGMFHLIAGAYRQTHGDSQYGSYAGEVGLAVHRRCRELITETAVGFSRPSAVGGRTLGDGIDRLEKDLRCALDERPTLNCDSLRP